MIGRTVLKIPVDIECVLLVSCVVLYEARMDVFDQYHTRYIDVQ